MSAKTLLASITMTCVVPVVASAQPLPHDDRVGWKAYRNDAMGFELKHPGDWQVTPVVGPETVVLGKPARVGEPRLAVQFWVQRKINPQRLPIEQWYADQLRRMKAARPPTVTTSLGGRAAMRMETVGTSERTFSFFTPLNTTDIFQVIIVQASSETQLHPTYQKILATIRFIE